MRRKPRKSQGFKCFQRGECEPSPEEAEEIRLRILSIQEFKEARAAETRYNATAIATVSFSAIRRHGYNVSRGAS